MATYRVHATKDYTVMSNAHLRDKEMSLKAKGLLSVMLSLPETWDYSMNGLCAICKENITAVKSALTELRDLGYLVITKLMPNETESGRIEYVYDIYETRKQAIEKQGIESLWVETQRVEKPPQLNTNKAITNQSNTNKANTENKKKVSKKDSFNAIFQAYTSDAEILDLLGEWMKVRKAKNAAMTDRAIQMNIDKLDELAQASNLSVKDYLSEVIRKGWAAFYEIKQFNSNNGNRQNYNNNGGNVFYDMAKEQGIY